MIAPKYLSRSSRFTSRFTLTMSPSVTTAKPEAILRSSSSHPRHLPSKAVGDPYDRVGEVHQGLAEIKEDEHPAIGHRRPTSEESYAAPRSVIAHPDLGPEFLQESVVVLVGRPLEPCPAFHR